MTDCPTSFAIWQQYAQGVCPDPTVPSGNLPFTGADVAALAVAGALLLALGILLRVSGRA